MKKRTSIYFVSGGPRDLRIKAVEKIAQPLEPGLFIFDCLPRQALNKYIENELRHSDALQKPKWVKAKNQLHKKFGANKMKKRLLVADADQRLKSVFRNSAKKLGFRLSIFKNGLDAYDSAHKSPTPELILIDYHLDCDGQGSGLARVLRNSGINAPIIMMKSAGRPSTLASQLDDIMFIKKPFLENELKGFIKANLKHMEV